MQHIRGSGRRGRVGRLGENKRGRVCGIPWKMAMPSVHLYIYIYIYIYIYRERERRERERERKRDAYTYIHIGYPHSCAIHELKGGKSRNEHRESIVNGHPWFIRGGRVLLT